MKTEKEIKEQMDARAHDYLDYSTYESWHITKGWLDALKWVLGE